MSDSPRNNRPAARGLASALATLPAHQSRLIRCPACGAIIAAKAAGLHAITVQRREWTGYLVSAKCACGAIWRLDGDRTVIQEVAE